MADKHNLTRHPAKNADVVASLILTIIYNKTTTV